MARTARLAVVRPIGSQALRILIVWTRTGSIPLLPIAAIPGVDKQAAKPTIADNRRSLKSPLNANIESSISDGTLRKIDISASFAEVITARRLAVTPKVISSRDNANIKTQTARECNSNDSWFAPYRIANLSERFFINRPKPGGVLQPHPPQKSGNLLLAVRR
jgi:hypothetical protein